MHLYKFCEDRNISQEYRKIIASSQDLRLASDYDDFYLASKQDTEKTLKDVQMVIKGVEDYLNSYYADLQWDKGLSQNVYEQNVGRQALFSRKWLS